MNFQKHFIYCIKFVKCYLIIHKIITNFLIYRVVISFTRALMHLLTFDFKEHFFPRPSFFFFIISKKNEAIVTKSSNN